MQGNGRVATLVIQRDREPSDPRREWDNLGIMACWHKKHQLGDVQPKTAYLNTWLEENAPKGSVVLPVYMMDHGGLKISTTYDQFRAQDSAGWDWGQLGVIVATPEAMRKAFCVKRITEKIRERARKALVSEIEVYDLYLQRECWGYIITDDDGEEDSCWGFLGSTLEETGIAAHIPDTAYPLLEEAWEHRQESNAE